jgi:hypothetical protein
MSIRHVLLLLPAIALARPLENSLTTALKTGDSYTWEVSDSIHSIDHLDNGNTSPSDVIEDHVTKSILEWTILSQYADSSDWLRFDVKQRATIIGGATSDTVLQLRISPNLGLVEPSVPQAQGLLILGSDSTGVSGARYRQQEWDTTSGNPLDAWTLICNSTLRIKSGLGLDSAWKNSACEWIGHHTTHSILRKDTTITYRLLSFNGAVLRTSGIAARHAAVGTGLTFAALRESMRDPTASLRAIGIDGRSQELARASWEHELLRSRGVRILELRTSKEIQRCNFTGMDSSR